MYYTSKKTFQLALAEKVGQIINSKLMIRNQFNVGDYVIGLDDYYGVGVVFFVTKTDMVWCCFGGKRDIWNFTMEGKLPPDELIDQIKIRTYSPSERLGENIVELNAAEYKERLFLRDMEIIRLNKMRTLPCVLNKIQELQSEEH
jgi:hypothetical protein